MKHLILVAVLVSGSFSAAQTALQKSEIFCAPGSFLAPRVKEGVQKVESQLFAMTSNDIDHAGAELNIQFLLMGLNQLLADPNQECVRQVEDYTLQLLPEVTNNLLFNLSQVLPADDQLGFSVLSLKFWKSVQDLQANGIRVGWVLNSPIPVNGVFIPDQNIIGINIMSDATTLRHEYRHYMQSHYFDQRSKYENLLIDHRATYVYSDSCLMNLNRYYNEVDASTEDIANWQTYLEHMFEIRSDTAAFLSSRFPQLNLLRVNLHYPEQVTESLVSDTSCPAIFITVAKEIRGQLKSDELVNTVDQLSSHLAVAQTLLKQNPGCESSAESDCRRYQTIMTEAEKLRLSLIDQLKAAYPQRKDAIQTTLNKMPDDEFRLWCTYSGAFHMMAGCEEIR